MQGTESQPEPALAKEEPETSGFRHRGSKHSNDVISPPSRLPWWFTWERVCLRCRRHRRRGSDPWVGQIPLEKGKAAHSSVLARGIPWTGEPSGLQSLGSQQAGHDLAINTHSLHPMGPFAPGQPRFSILQKGLSSQGKGDVGSPGFTNPSSATPGQKAFLFYHASVILCAAWPHAHLCPDWPRAHLCPVQGPKGQGMRTLPA